MINKSRSIKIIASVSLGLCLIVGIVYAAGLPTVGGDSGTWGTVLNAFLQVSHDNDGYLSEDTVNTTMIEDSTIVDDDISAAAAIDESKLDTIATAGKVLGDAITSGTITGSTGMETTGRINSAVPTYYNDFWTRRGMGATGDPWQLKTNTGTRGNILAAPETDVNGWIKFTTGNQVGDEISYQFETTYDFINTQQPIFETRLKVTGGVNTDFLDIYVGLIDSVGTYDGSAGDIVSMQFSKTDYTDTEWHLRTANGGVTSTDDGEEFTAAAKVFRFEFVDDATVEWFIDGVSQGTIATNVPTASLTPFLAVITQQGTIKNTEFDYVKLWQDRA